MSIEIICDSGYSAREWISKDGERHNIFIKDKNGEVGWIDLKTGKLVNKSQTPKGLNQQALRELKKMNFYKNLNLVSIKILKRLKGK